MKRIAAPVCLLVCLALGLQARAGEAAYEGGSLLARVVRVLRLRLPGEAQRIEEHAEALGAEARACTSEGEERHVAFRLLERVPTSHLCLVSGFGYRTATADLMGRDHVTLGLWLVELEGRYFADHVLYGGPAFEAGIRRGDEVTALDGVDVRASPRLDFRTDDAFLPDPPTHFVLCEKDVPVRLGVRTRRDQAEPVDVVVRPTYTSTAAADRAAVRILSLQGVQAGYVSIHLMTYQAGKHLQDALAGPLAECDTVIVDIRGRGGSPAEIWACLAHLKRARARGVRLLVLTDGRTRSAKEILAQRVRDEGLATLVGERTAGAVRRSRFYRVGDDSWLLCPAYGLETTFSGGAARCGAARPVRRFPALVARSRPHPGRGAGRGDPPEARRSVARGGTRGQARLPSGP